MAKRTILIVDDEKSIAKLIAYNLEKAGFETLASRNGEDALRVLSERRIDLILLDIMLPGMDGLAVCKAIRQDPRTRAIPVIMLTAKGEEIDRIVGFELGADDYIIKQFSPRELILRMHAIFKRGATEDKDKKEVLIADDIRVDIPKHVVTVKGKAIELTRMEFKLLCTLIERRGRVQTRDRLLDDVWGMDTMVETRTIDTRVKSLRSKLGKAGNLIKTIRGLGYRLNDSNED